MATLQIFIGNNTHEDPKKDALCWKEGQVIAVYPDGVCTEPPEEGSKSAFIHIPGVSVEEVNKYIESEYAPADAKGERKKIGRRQFNLDLSLLAQDKKDSLQESKAATLEFKTTLDQVTKEKEAK